MRLPILAILTVLAASLMVGGCTATSGGSASPSGSANTIGASSGASSPTSSPGASNRPATTLDGRTFLSTNVQGYDLVPGSTVRLSFQDGRLGVSAGCNQMGGSYTVVDGHLTTGQMMSTEMGCDPPLMAQDTWIAGFLDGAATMLAGDTLTLANNGVTMTLTDRKVADPDRPLEGTRWVVDGLVSGDAVSSVPGGVTASIVIKNGQMLLDTGCNTGSATVTTTESTLTIGTLVVTKKACDPAATSVEQAVVATLSGPVGYTVEAGRLTLSADGSGLMLRAAS
jgi:heat shock protein HslJ